MTQGPTLVINKTLLHHLQRENQKKKIKLESYTSQLLPNSMRLATLIVELLCCCMSDKYHACFEEQNTFQKKTLSVLLTEILKSHHNQEMNTNWNGEDSRTSRTVY